MILLLCVSMKLQIQNQNNLKNVVLTLLMRTAYTVYWVILISICIVLQLILTHLVKMMKKLKVMILLM